MARIRGLSHNDLQEAPGSPGITRRLAFQEDSLHVIRATGEPDTASGWHHHGNHSVYGFVISGSIHFEYGPHGESATVVGPGDFFHVPPETVHRDVNPSKTEQQEVVLYLQGNGPMVVNVDGPEP